MVRICEVNSLAVNYVNLSSVLVVYEEIEDVKHVRVLVVYEEIEDVECVLKFTLLLIIVNMDWLEDVLVVEEVTMLMQKCKFFFKYQIHF